MNIQSTYEYSHNIRNIHVANLELRHGNNKPNPALNPWSRKPGGQNVSRVSSRQSVVCLQNQKNSLSPQSDKKLKSTTSVKKRGRSKKSMI